MTYFEAQPLGVARMGSSSQHGALPLVFALLVAGCSAGSTVTPGDGAGGQGGGPGTMSVVTCDGTPPSGVGVPAGTVTTASNSDDTDPSANAIDGDVVDEWSSGTTAAWITLTFPTPVMIGAVLIHADAKPQNNEIFTLSTSSSTVPLASLTATIMEAPAGTLLPELSIPPGLYRDITVAVNAGSSWVGVNEIWLLAASTCP